MKTITWLSPQDAPERFPPLERALDEPAGLLAAGGDLSPARLLAAYQRGWTVTAAIALAGGIVGLVLLVSRPRTVAAEAAAIAAGNG